MTRMMVFEPFPVAQTEQRERGSAGLSVTKTPKLSHETTERQNMKRRKAIGVTVVGVIGLLAISGAVINAAKLYVAPLSTGEIRVAGLGADVEITRNEIGAWVRKRVLLWMIL